jgi:uncharacterized protein (DUF1800 family)
MHTKPPARFRAVLTMAAALTALAAPILAQRDSAVPARPDSRTITHVLNRLGFGPRPGDIERVEAMGLAKYIDHQLHPERVQNSALDERLAPMTTLSMSNAELMEKYFAPADQLRQAQQRQQAQQAKQQAQKAAATPPDSATAGTTPPPAPPRPAPTPEQRMIQQGQQNVMNELMNAKILRAAGSERQLEEVLVDFWFNHFNVFIGKGQVRQYLTDYEQQVIRPHVLGSFRDLLGATAHSPAMLFYLDNFQSVTPNPTPMISPEMERRLNDPRIRPEQRAQIMIRLQQRPQQRPQRGLNENYARELMELHTLGVDGGYTQKDVQEVARVFTGWTIDQPRAGGSFVFRPQMHDQDEKLVLGTKIKPDGQREGEKVLDLLASHPSTAHHVAFKLAQRFVADEPPKALVDRAAKRFLDTKGDLREVTRVIITSKEFFAEDAYRAKVKTPLEFVVSAARATDANIVNPQPIVNALRQLGMPLYGAQPPTGYSMTADAWVNTGALLNRMNFAVQLVSGGQQLQAGRGGRGAPNPQQQQRLDNRPLPDPRLMRPEQLARMPLQVDLQMLAPDTTDATRDRLIRALLAGDASEATRTTLARAETPQQLVALTLGSPEFQRR